MATTKPPNDARLTRRQTLALLVLSSCNRDRGQIEAMLDSVASTISSPNPRRALHQGMASWTTRRVSVQCPWDIRGEYDRDELGARLADELEPLKRLNISLSEVMLREHSKSSASVVLSADVSESQPGDLHRWRLPLNVGLRRLGAQWRIERVTVDNTETYLPEARP